MRCPSRIGPAGGAGRICEAGAVSEIRIRVGEEFRTVKQTLTEDIKRSRQSLHDANIGAHKIDEPVSSARGRRAAPDPTAIGA
jgi:hypothetical protein